MLEIRHLNFSYPKKEIFNDISFKLSGGEITAIIGKNAVGKTTLINILTGQYKCNSGEIFLNDVSIENSIPLQIKEKIGVLRPIEGLFRKMTCMQYLEFISALYGIKDTHLILNYAEKFDFKSELSRQIKKSSLGTIKKVEFVAAIIHNPQVLLLDEPFESVDPLIVSELKKFIIEFSQSDKIVIITSHILDLLQNICNRYIIIDNTKIIYDQSHDLTQCKSSELERIFIEKVKNNE